METEEKLKILMLEDNPDDVLLVERILKKDGLQFESLVADTREEFTQAIHEFHPDVILSDHGLPRFNSIEALKICIEVEYVVPFILVTGTVSEEFAATCLKQGADDYILKSNLSRLPSAIRRAINEKKLETLKREQTIALQNKNDQLRQANAELTKTNKELDSFVYCVSHNLRGPLKSVLGLLHLAALDEGRNEIEKIHSMIASSVGNLDNTLCAILDYSRNSRIELAPEAINWSELLDSIQKKLSYLDTGNNVIWEFSMLPGNEFYTDKTRLAVLLENIIANAMIFRSASCTIRISVEADISNAIVTIRDNGIGIDPSVIPRVFDMFYRGNEKSQGAGLGLYVVHEILRVLNGQISIESMIAGGTTVIFSLPNAIR